MFWPFFFIPPSAVQPRNRTTTRLRDLDARMTTFLAEKQQASDTSPEVLDNIKTARSKVQRELAGVAEHPIQ